MSLIDKIAALSESQRKTLMSRINKLPANEQVVFLSVLEELEDRKRAEAARGSLIDFCLYLKPDYKVGKHHRDLAAILEDMAYGRKHRTAVNIAPRFGKSMLTSEFFPAWFIGHFPGKKIMMVSHTAELAVDFGRKVRNIVDSADYQRIFPDVALSKDSKSAGRWNTNHGGEYFAVGVGGALAGRGADLLVIDDPHNEQEILNGNLEIFERAYEWYAYGARTRLMPGGAVALVMCMTGDTQVLMADGAEKRLDQIQIGDRVATYENGGVTTTTVKNWKCSGSDYVYKIRTTCGKIVRANERHPFLVDRDGDLLWVRLKALKPGDTLVSLTDATDWDGLKQNQASVSGVNPETHTTEKTPTPHTYHLDTTGSGKVRNALSEGVTTQHTRMDYVKSTTTRNTTRKKDIRKRPSQSVHGVLNTATELLLTVMSACSLNKMANAQFVGSHPAIMLELTGVANYASTTAMTPTELEHFYATTATSQLGTQKHQKPQKKSLSIYGVTGTQIASIEYDGVELVYDVTIERTENFIANGVVSHNTRWAQNDLTGSIVQDMVRKPDADQWEVVEFPALLERKNVPYDAPPAEKYLSLWPEFWSVEDLLRTKESMPSFQWNAQYMQQPTSKESAIIKPDWWQKWTKENPPSCEYIIMALDAAAETNNRADFTSLTTWGVFYFNDKDTGAEKAGIILLDAIKERLEFPELKRLALTEYKNWQADWFVVEKKSSGTPLYQELRRIGIPVQEFTPHRGTGDKTARLNSIADIFASGHVWYPHGLRWAEELVDEVCGFPNMQHDDQVDTTIMSLMRFRLGGFISLSTDGWDEDDYEPRRAAYY